MFFQSIHKCSSCRQRTHQTWTRITRKVIWQCCISTQFMCLRMRHKNIREWWTGKAEGGRDRDFFQGIRLHSLKKVQRRRGLGITSHGSDIIYMGEALMLTVLAWLTVWKKEKLKVFCFTLVVRWYSTHKHGRPDQIKCIVSQPQPDRFGCF
jgi:hypothetical protein